MYPRSCPVGTGAFQAMTVQVSEKEQFLREFSQRLEPLSVRQLAAKSGWGRTTVSDLKSGRRLATADQLEHLLAVVGADPVEIDQWRDRLRNLPRSAAPQTATPASVRPPGNSARPAGKASLASGGFGPFLARHRGTLGTMTFLAAALLFGSGVVVGRATAPRPALPTDAVALIARVANTDGLGVDMYAGPSRAGGRVGALSEGADLHIVCQDGAGETITDRVAGKRLVWPVWDRLVDGTWVPDIYTSTNKSYTPGPGRTALVSC